MAKKMFFGVSTHLGGAERSLLDFLKTYNMDSDHSDFFALLPKADGPLVEELKHYKIPYKVLPIPPWILKMTRDKLLWPLFPFCSPLSVLLYLKKLNALIDAEKIDTIHCTGIKCHVFACLLSPFTSARIIVHFRDIISPPALVHFFALFKNNKNILWLAASHAIRTHLPTILPTVVYDGVNEKTFFPAHTQHLKELFNIPRTDTLFGLVGIVAKWKGHQQFLLAASELLKERQDCHFIIVGDQIYDTSGDQNFLKELKVLCQNLGIAANFHFLGFQNDTAPIYNSLDWLVHTSISPEPFGRVVPEAMLCKTPIIASRAGGILEIIEEGKTGLLHTPGDVKDLVLTFKKALAMPDFDKNTLVENAYEF